MSQPAACLDVAASLQTARLLPGGGCAEVNAPTTWRSWGLEGKDGKLKYNPFPPVAFIAMEVIPWGERWGCSAAAASGSPHRPRWSPGGSHAPQRDHDTNQLIYDRIADLKRFGVPADYIMVGWMCLSVSQLPRRTAARRQPLVAPCSGPLQQHKLRGCLPWPAPQVKSRPIDRLWFYNRSPAISAKQSSAIVEAMMQLGFIDSKGNLKYDPRIGALVSS